MKLEKYSLILLLLLFQQPLWAFDWVGVDLQGAPCTGGPQGYGPYDYTNPDHLKNKLPIVEAYHFTREVESLQHGKSSYVAEDLDYTLRAFPNHHRALYAVIRYATEQHHNHQPLMSAPECYLQRAIAFSPRDAKARLLFGIYLHKKKKAKDAELLYRQALKLSPKSAETHYNLGLLLTDLKRYQEAKEQARLAYQLGYPLQGLRRRLQEAGQSLD